MELLNTVDLKSYLPKLKQKFDLLIAADVFSYLGDLQAVMHNCFACLQAQGLLAFSVEISTDAEQQLQLNARYAYSKAYLERLRQQNSWQLLFQEQKVIRHQDHQPVEGLLTIWQKV